ncbi:MAG: SAM-dependent methyltransferase [Eubacterium sp.]|nr:SAM-dependent methyltransferase [Eubacterium sp.]MCM1214201.1 SAM-dependent methyltransferase [Lachnospiraceae bacterium]MCM1238139.1 SAM-dependent methyltransferase [Lachnospiraceae bacterium]
MARNDITKSKVDYLIREHNFTNRWSEKPITTELLTVLKKASKGHNRRFGNEGIPDGCYENAHEKLLILMEVKTSVNEHTSGYFDEEEIEKKIEKIVVTTKDDKDDLDGILDDMDFSPSKYSVDGIKWYMSFFKPAALNSLGNNYKNFMRDWSVIGIAVSGDPDKPIEFCVDTYMIRDGKIKDLEIHDILNEEDYISIANDVDTKAIIETVTDSSEKINNLLVAVDSQRRPIILSALLICLFKPERLEDNSFVNDYNGWTPKHLAENIRYRVDDVLRAENVPQEKLDVIDAEIGFISVDPDITSKPYLKAILNELNNNIIPLFKRKSNYDVIGKFYESFLKWAGVTNVKKGIVLTPAHITSLFTKLIDIREDDVVMDPCCGTGSFLISAMNCMIRLKTQRESEVTARIIDGFGLEDFDYMKGIENLLKLVEEGAILRENAEEICNKISVVNQKDLDGIMPIITSVRQEQLEDMIYTIKKRQLIGFEKNTSMYILAMSNMLFRGDGKSNIYHVDYFSDEVFHVISKEEEQILKGTDVGKKRKIQNAIESTILGGLSKNEGIKPTIGFINPPYSGGYDDYEKLQSDIAKAASGTQKQGGKKKPWMKEISFLERLLSQCSRYCIMIAPLSAYYKDQKIRNRILINHTLKYVISMPDDLFQPNASTHTAIVVFECNKPQKDTETVFYDLRDDGFVLHKTHGRVDSGKWSALEYDMINAITNDPKKNANDYTLIVHKPGKEDEWTINQYSKTDYSQLTEKDFENQLKKYALFRYMEDNANIEEAEVFD